MFIFNFKDAVLSKKYDAFMFLCCVLYTMTAMPDLGMSGILKNIIIFGTLPILYYYLKENSHNKRIIWLFITSIVIQVLSWVNSLFLIPEYAYSSPNLKLLSSMFLFVFIAFWVGNRPKKRIILFSSLIAGFVLTILYEGVYNHQFDQAIRWIRVDFGLYNAQFTSMIAAIVIMVCLYLISVVKKNKTTYVVVLLAIILLSLWVLVISQSRQVWLASLIIIAAIPLILRKYISVKYNLAFYLILFVSVVGIVNTDFFQKRITPELGTIEKILEGDWENVPMTSWGIRFNSWVEASSWIKDSPIIGASKSAVRQVIQSSELFQSSARTRGFGHLHNYYIETLVAFGFVGVLFIVSFYTVISQNIMKHSDYSTKVFYVCFLLFWLIINNFESFNTKGYGLYIHSIIIGSLFFMPKPSTSKSAPPLA